MATSYLDPTQQGALSSAASTTNDLTGTTTTSSTQPASGLTTGVNSTTPATGGGALSSAAGTSTGSTPTLTTPTLSSATTWTPSEADMASTRLTSMLDQGSTYLTRARAKAAQYAQSRGLLNSSIGASAGEAAAIDAAAPIAQSDAATLAKAGEFNANASNQVNQQANDFQVRGALAQFDAANTAEQNRLQRESTASENAMQRAEQARQFDQTYTLDQQRLTAQTTQQNADRQVGVSDRIAALQQNAMNQIAQIDQSSLDAAGKAAAMQRVWDQLDASITLAVQESGVTMPATWQNYVGVMQQTVQNQPANAGGTITGAPAASGQPPNTHWDYRTNSWVPNDRETFVDG